MIFRTVIEIERARQLPATTLAGTRRSTLAHEIWNATLLLGVLPLAVMLFFVMTATRGHFAYSLDAPYGCLALARNLWHGHYGIGAHELSATTSGVLWPFLLAPFSTLGAAFDYMPLIVNIACMCATVAVVSQVFSELRYPVRLTVTGVLVLSLNLVGVAFAGMEHGLQVLLTAIAISPVLPLTRKHRQSTPALPMYVIVALTLLPLLGYEGLAISLPVLAFLFKRGHRREAVTSLSIIVIAIAAFSLFLHANGLAVLWSSEMAKTGFEHSSVFLNNQKANLYTYGVLLIPVVWMLRVFWRIDRPRFGVVLASTALYLLVGHYGWFGRYEVLYALFVALMSARLVMQMRRPLLPGMLLVPFALSSLVSATLFTPLAASNIAARHSQSAKLVSIANAPVGLNDPLFVALRSHE